MATLIPIIYPHDIVARTITAIEILHLDYYRGNITQEEESEYIRNLWDDAIADWKWYGFGNKESFIAAYQAERGTDEI